MKTTKTYATATKTSSEIALFDELDVPRNVRSEIADTVGEFLVEKILENVSQQKSPISGQGKFKGLSKEYKKIKLADGRGSEANLELTGAMLDALEYKTTKSGMYQLRLRRVYL